MNHDIEFDVDDLSPCLAKLPAISDCFSNKEPDAVIFEQDCQMPRKSLVFKNPRRSLAQGTVSDYPLVAGG